VKPQCTISQDKCAKSLDIAVFAFDNKKPQTLGPRDLNTNKSG